VLGEAINFDPDYSVTSLAIFGNGSRIAAGTKAGRVFVWVYPDQEDEDWFDIPFGLPSQKSISRLECFAEGTNILATTAKGIAAWNLDTHDPLFAVENLGTIMDVAISPDDSCIAVACESAGVRMLDAATGEITKTFDWRLGDALSVAFSPDGTRAAAGGEGGRIVLWDVDL
jgi:WD40 repeat protein